MTAEIALLNKEAVALAADSAVTITLPNGFHKILPSANKIFSLSKYHPVGVMIYGNAQLVEVPWEVIIKEYRRSIGSRSFDTLDEYATDFIKYVQTSRKFFPEVAQERAYLNEVRLILAAIKEEFENRVGALASIARSEHKPPPSASDEMALLREIIDSMHEYWGAMAPLPKLPATFSKQIKHSYKAKILEAISDEFDELSIPKSLTNKLIDLAVWGTDRLPLHHRASYSGVVIAGYGNEDVFASLRSYFIGGIVGNTLVYADHKHFDVTTSSAAVLPFAQNEMVSAFMEGIDKRFMEVIAHTVDEMLEGMVQYSRDLAGRDPEESSGLEEALRKGKRSAR